MHIHTFTYPQKPQPNDKVAILSPSSGLPERFPTVFEQGLQRLRDIEMAKGAYPCPQL
jgi:muramoyltetrapeptide carboxypeptidase LdcA involved in peptidoglycan recycling